MKILHIDASGRPGLGGLPPHGPYGSYSRRLSGHFISRWLAHLPDTEVEYRDLAAPHPNRSTMPGFPPSSAAASPRLHNEPQWPKATC